MEEIFLSNSAKKTQEIAKNFIEDIKNCGVILLYGNLGAGKTTFVQGLAKGLGIKKRIISPTFIILRTYELEKRNFYHVDLYRLSQEKEIIDLGLSEIMQNLQNITVIEWPEKLGKLVPKKAVKIYFETIGGNERKIKIRY